jgi:hypothetical protein
MPLSPPEDEDDTVVNIMYPQEPPVSLLFLEAGCSLKYKNQQRYNVCCTNCICNLRQN